MASGTLLNRLMAVRHASEALIEPLDTEDLNLQGMADASPPKWHLAHTTWFFDTFLLQPHLSGHTACDPRWSYQFNSYYEAVGARPPRPQPPPWLSRWQPKPQPSQPAAGDSVYTY